MTKRKESRAAKSITERAAIARREMKAYNDMVEEIKRRREQENMDILSARNDKGPDVEKAVEVSEETRANMRRAWIKRKERMREEVNNNEENDKYKV